MAKVGGLDGVIVGWIRVTTRGKNAGVGVESVGTVAGSWVVAKGGNVGDRSRVFGQERVDWWE